MLFCFFTFPGLLVSPAKLPKDLVWFGFPQGSDLGPGIFHGIFRSYKWGAVFFSKPRILPKITGQFWFWKLGTVDYRSKWLGGGFKYFLHSPLFGEMIQFDEYLSNGLKLPARCFWCVFFSKMRDFFLNGRNWWICVGNYPVFGGKGSTIWRHPPFPEMVPEELHVKRRWESWESVRGCHWVLGKQYMLGRQIILPNNQPGVV